MNMDENKAAQMPQLPRPGEVIDGRYELQEIFASGGMGMIMKARQIRTGRNVAVKLLHPHVAVRDNFATRFKREANVATLFDHPHIVRVYDVGETKDGALYLVMELLEGEELKDIIAREAPLPADRVFEIGLQMLDGLAEAHSQEVVHRDFKPSNVFVGKTRRGKDSVKLLDFGIAKLIDSKDANLTATGSFTGTPSYVAPETMLQSVQINKKAADVYAAGLVLMEMLTGQRVFDGDGMAQTLLFHLKKPVVIPRAVAQTPLGEVIRRSTAKHPDDRYADADAMYTALSEARQGTPADLLLTAGQIPGPSPDTSPSLLEQLAAQGGETSLDMLRKMPQHEEFSDQAGDFDDFEAAPTTMFEASQPVASDLDPGPTRIDPMPLDQTTEDIPNHLPKPEPQPEKKKQTSTMSTSSAKSKQSSRPAGWLLAGGLGVGLVLAVGAFFLFTANDELEDGSDQNSVVAQEPPPESESEPETTEEPTDELVFDNPTVEEFVLEFRLETEPSDASVWMDDQNMGATSLDLEIDESALPTTLRVEKDGYIEQLVELDDNSDPGISLVLEPVVADEPPPREARAERQERPRPNGAPTGAVENNQSDSDKSPDLSIDRMVDEFLPD